MDLNLDSIKAMMDGLDPAALLPEVDSIVGWITTLCRVAILVGPVVLLLMGLSYLLAAPKEANYYVGYRTTFGMGSVSAWRRTQKLAGFVFGGAGLVLLGIMLLISMGMTGADPMATVWLAAKCLIWQAVATVAVILTINIITALTYDYQGNKRKK